MLADALERDPARAFWLFALAQLVMWTLIPALVFGNLPLDVVELLSWGHEWQLGYSKHPPMPAWTLEALAVVSGGADWPAWFISQLCIFATYWAIWRLGREIAGEMAALLAVLLTSLIYYFNLPTIEFNHNVLALPFWALMGLSGWLALRDNRLRDWLALGLFAGLSIYIKYSQAIMVLTLLSFALVHAQTRMRFASRGVWLGMGFALLVASPHLYWLYINEFQSLFYASGRTRPLVGAVAHITGPVKFLVAQFLVHGALLLVVLLGGAILPMDRARGEQPVRFAVEDRLARAFLLWIALVPVLFTGFLSLVLGLKFRSMWGMPMFSFSALALIVFLRPVYFKERFGFMAASWVLAHAGLLLALVVMGTMGGTMGAQFGKKLSRTDYPGRAIGAYFSQLWREKAGSAPRYVGGDEWIAGNIAWYGETRSSQIFNTGFWVRNQAGMSTGSKRPDIACKGALLVWNIAPSGSAQIPEIYGPGKGRYEIRGKQEFATKLAGKPLRIGWAIKMPGKDCLDK